MPVVARTAPDGGITLEGVKIERVKDGDTVVISGEFHLTVRLLAGHNYLDAPEKHTIPGDKAAKDLKEHAEGKPGIAHFPLAQSLEEMVSFGRAKGEVWILEDKTESLSDWQIKQGNAVVGST